MLLINGSSRELGNSEQLAKHMLTGINFEEVNLREYQIEQIVDKRHEEAGFTYGSDEYSFVLEKFLHADTVIFSSPIYWYGISGGLKNFIDRWSESLRLIANLKERVQGKKIYLVLVGGDNPTEKGKLIIQQFRYICEFLEMNFSGYLIGRGSKPGEVMADEKALEQGRKLNEVMRKNNE